MEMCQCTQSKRLARPTWTKKDKSRLAEGLEGHDEGCLVEETEIRAFTKCLEVVYTMYRKVVECILLPDKVPRATIILDDIQRIALVA